MEYVSAIAVFQLSIKGTLIAMKILDEPSEWNPRVSSRLCRIPPPLTLHLCCQGNRVSHLQAVAAVVPFLEASMSADEAKAVGQAFIDRIEKEDELKAATADIDEEDGEPLTEKPLKFSLAYGESLVCHLVSAPHTETTLVTWTVTSCPVRTRNVRSS